MRIRQDKASGVFVGEAAYQLSCSSGATALTSNQPPSIPAERENTSFKTTHLSHPSIRTLKLSFNPKYYYYCGNGKTAWTIRFSHSGFTAVE